jgi:uncharacterized protein YndB with AHSA1/START domain
MSKLQVSVEGTQEVHLTRVFNAPRELVLEAMTSPELIKRWLGGVRATVVSAEFERRVGGKYRYVLKPRAGGGELAFGGVIEELAQYRVVQTESFEGFPGSSVVTTTWEEDGPDKTIMKVVIRFDSPAIRDAVLATGMTDGAGESYDAMEAILAERR